MLRFCLLLLHLVVALALASAAGAIGTPLSAPAPLCEECEEDGDVVFEDEEAFDEEFEDFEEEPAADPEDFGDEDGDGDPSVTDGDAKPQPKKLGSKRP